MHSTTTIFEPYKLGAYLLKNRIMMPGLSRGRCDDETGTPPIDLYSQYLSERAESAGIVVTGSCWVSRRGKATHFSPGLVSEEQSAAWAKIVKAVHDKEGIIFAQLEHGGRVCTHEILKGEKPLGSSPVLPRNQLYENFSGNDFYEMCEEMTEQDIVQVIKEFKNAAENAKKAGFDGVEVHAAGGFLVDQFLRDHTNRRTDMWGGSIENRCRFALAVVDEVIKVFGADKVGTKVSPTGRLHDMYDSDPLKLYSYLLAKLDERGIAYVQLEEGERHLLTKHETNGSQIENNAKTFRQYFKGILVTNRDLTIEEAKRRISEGEADMAAFGKNFISNPDLVERFKNNWPLTKIDFANLNYGGAAGLIDYKKYSSEQD